MTAVNNWEYSMIRRSALTGKICAAAEIVPWQRRWGDRRRLGVLAAGYRYGVPSAPCIREIPLARIPNQAML
jgi:hypothetical protein